MKNIFYILILLPACLYANPHYKNSRDSLFLNSQNVVDTTFQNTSIDSLAVSDSVKTDDDLDGVIIATAKDSLTFNVAKKKMYLYGTGNITYKESELSSGFIDVDFTTNDVKAEGRKDTTGGTEKIVETPVLKDGGETYEGARLKYNFKSKKGFISMAKNKMDEVRYEGEKVKKVDKDTYFIEDGIYTTCNADTPHTHFSAQQMKVIAKDKIIAKWIFMYIGGVPLPIPIPFAVFPTESGRRSGIIIPSYGTTADQGQFFRNFGYYWAISDYLDFSLTGDYYTRGGYGIAGRTRYAKRYSFYGNVYGKYSKSFTGEYGDPDRTENKYWTLNVNHQQTINPTTNLSVNLNFSSTDYYRANSFNMDDLLKQYITSNATLNKRWEESGNSMSISYSRTQSLQDGDFTEYLPTFNFNKSFEYPFRNESATDRELKWYEYIGYNYSGKFNNKRVKTGSNLNVRGGIEHDLSISASPKVGYFTISPSISYSEKWYNKRILKEYSYNDSTGNDGVIVIDSAGTLITKDKKEINSVRTFSLSVSASTKIYGMMPINNFGIDAFRHTVTPSISYSYQPDFSTKFWNYYDNAYGRFGEQERYDKFSQEIFGGVGSGQSQSLNFRVGNIFEVKTLKNPTDTTSEAKKYTLLNLDFGVSYNFAADSLKFSEPYISARNQIGEYVSLDSRASFSLYDYENNRTVNKFLYKQGKGLLRLTNFSVSLSSTLSGEKLSGSKAVKDKQKEGEQGDEEAQFKSSDYIALYDEQPPDFEIPWSLVLGFYYNYNKSNPNHTYELMTLNLSGSVSISEKWKLTLRGTYDFQTHQISAPQITINRDLHCWEMNFSWNPLGRYRGFNFEIRMKAPELRDIKVTKTQGQGLYSGIR